MSSSSSSSSYRSSSSQSVASLSISSSPYGRHPSGKEVTIWTLINNTPGGIEVKAIDYGAILTSVLIPSPSGGGPIDVLLGYSALSDWVNGKPWLNSLVGRCANRIRGGKFTLDGKEVQLETNNGPNHLHGGTKGFNAALLSSQRVDTGDPAEVAVKMSFVSPHGDNGYPGAVEVCVVYVLNSVNELRMEFHARHAEGETRKTIVNLCNHGYWRLSPTGTTILNHKLYVNADSITELDNTMAATGRIVNVSGTGWDFSATEGKTIGENVAALDKVLPAPGGVDVNYVLNKSSDMEAVVVSPLPVFKGETGSAPLRLTIAARLNDPESGRHMEVFTSAPGVQVYSGNFLDNSIVGKGGEKYAKHSAVCLETQAFPDSVNHLEEWRQFNTDTVLKKGGRYLHVTVHRFTAPGAEAKATDAKAGSTKKE